MSKYKKPTIITKNKILLLTKKFSWSEKYIRIMKKNFENQLEFIPCKY